MDRLLLNQLVEVIEGRGRRWLKSLFTTAPTPDGVALDAFAPGTIGVLADGEEGRRFVSYAKPGTARAGLLRILQAHGVRTAFPPAVEAEAAAWLAAPGIDDPSLVDLSHLPFVTIDNEDSRDLDQALYIETQASAPVAADANVAYVVWYALADAAYYVRPGTALYEEALLRGTSVYLPGLSVPMLPEVLSNDLVSLNPEVHRRAMVFAIQVDAAGQVLRTEIMRGRILSRAKLSYDGVQVLHDTPALSPLSGQAYTPSLLLLGEVGAILMAAAKARNVVTFNRVDLEVRLNADGSRFTLGLENRNAVSRWNEQISLLCNIEGARFMLEGEDDGENQAIYRIHQSPGAHSLGELRVLIDELVRAHGLRPSAWGWRQASESLADYLERLPMTGQSERLRAAIERQILLIHRRSVFSPEPGEHYALGVNPYCRFSSPMREIVGVFTHREAYQKLGIALAVPDSAYDTALRTSVIDAANRARQIQRNVSKAVDTLAVEQVMGEDLAEPVATRPRYVGTILGMKATSLYVRLDDPPVELKVHYRDIERVCNTELRLDKAQVVLSDAAGQTLYRVGDPIVLRVDAYNPQRRKWSVIPVLEEVDL